MKNGLETQRTLSIITCPRFYVEKPIKYTNLFKILLINISTVRLSDSVRYVSLLVACFVNWVQIEALSHHTTGPYAWFNPVNSRNTGILKVKALCFSTEYIPSPRAHSAKNAYIKRI